MNPISENIERIEKNIQNAIDTSSREREEVLLLAVTKTQPIEAMEEVFNQGLIYFGENKVQEFNQKYDEFSERVKWHFIGHLQTNKVKNIIGKVELIHSVDSLRLAEEINKQSNKKNCITNILIEVNVALEESKFGISVNNLESFLHEIGELEHINVKGLMTVAPFVENPENNREIFRKMKGLLVDNNNKNIHNICMTELSMGMSNDYKVAIEEGATIVRIGTDIFGKREYK